MAAAQRTLIAAACAAFALALAPAAFAGGGTYVFDGGTARERAEVRAALEASAFDWGLVPAVVTIHLAPGVGTFSSPGHIWLDANVLTAGRFAWAVVQDEYAHQVDFFLLDEAKRSTLKAALGGQDWCRGVPGLPHAAYACERFASTFVWAYWPSPENAYRPTHPRDESAAMEPGAFRELLASLIGAPRLLASSTRIGSKQAGPRRTASSRARHAADSRRSGPRR